MEETNVAKKIDITPTKHEQETVILQKACVDREIIPLIKWMNGFDGIKTLFCCEGDENLSCGSPYVLFLVTDMRSLVIFANYCDMYMHGWTLAVKPYLGMIRYYLKFNQKEDLLRSVDTIKKVLQRDHLRREGIVEE